MKFGCCVDIDKYDELQNLGYDFIELSGTGIYEMSEDEFTKTKEIIDNGILKCLGFNAFLKAEIKIVGRDIDEKKITEYVDKVVQRASELNIQHIGLGSPISRTIPEGVSRKTAMGQFCEFAISVAEKIEGYGMKLLIEPLNKEETNFINSVEEAMEIIKRIKHKNVGLLLDIYHFFMEKENIIALNHEIVSYIEHIHIADDEGRTYLKTENRNNYRKIINRLKDLGYMKGISIEGNYENFDIEAACSLDILKNIKY